MNILLIGEVGRLGAERAHAFRRRGHRITETGVDHALARASELSPDIIVLDTGGLADYSTDAPDLGTEVATRDVPVLAVHLSGDLPGARLVALVERVAGEPLAYRLYARRSGKGRRSSSAR